MVAALIGRRPPGSHRNANQLIAPALAAGFEALFVPRLTAIKFPALYRENVYRDKPCHEQSAWLQRIRSDINFESTHLARMIASDQATRGLPLRKLARILAEELKKRFALRLSWNSGYRAMLWPAKGAGIDDHKKYKGVK